MPLPARNLLATSASPYLLQHAANPVHWRPWGEDALAEARETGRPILLSIGYAACHWCHVMARESFEDPETAALMNRLFVNIKVDREERPDIDQIYMGALQAFGEPGGWPLTMFLRPNGEPFWGGTYFPPEPRWGRPSFRMILEEMARVHRDEPEKVAGNGVAIRRRLETRHPSAGTLGPDFLDAVAERLLDHMDPANGGLKGAPKFPQPALLELLWRAERRRPDLASRTSVLRTLACMSRGGIWDHLGGGFARYSIDALWLVPHFEKMLYDNAQLLHLLGLAWSLTGDPLFRSRIEGIVDWLAREMTLPDGAFATSIDADSEHEEGRFYVWTLDEISEVLGSETEDFAHAYDVTATGNWEGRVILNRRRDAGPVTPEHEARLADARARLLARRAGRIRPATDDKCLTDWNGLAIHGLVSVARRLDRTDWLDRAIAAYRAVVLAMGEGDRLAHAGRDGHRVFPGLASDLAHMTRAALLLAETTGDSDFLRDALRWSGALEAHHADPAGGWFVTADDAAPLIVRPVSTHDDALPNPNAVIVENALRLSALTGDPSWRLRAEAALESFTGTMKADILSSASLSNALDSVLDLAEIVLVIPPGTDGRALRRVVFESIEPATVLFESESTASLAPDHPAFGKVADAGRPTAWVCRAGRCSLPVTAPAALRALIDRDSKHLDV